MKHIKKSWVSPVKSMQTFMPQEYCENCYRFCCDCESSNTSGNDLYYGIYTWVGGDQMGNGCFAEVGDSSKLHHGPNCVGDANFDYICHTTNTGLGTYYAQHGNIDGWYEIWNTYIDGVITSPYGANAPTFTGQHFVAYGQDQQLVYFTDSQGKTHYGRAVPIPGRTWNHS